MKLIVGLGNPGQQYAGTRHNIGFEVVERLAAELAWCAPGDFDRVARNKFGALLLEGALNGHGGDRRLLLLKPTTYMNLSGQSVGAAVNYYKIPTEHVLVAYDELDLAAGRAQLRFDGGSAGHNGVSSVIEHIGTAFWRLRFGIGHPRDKEQAGGRKDVIDHVLKRAAGSEETALRAKLGEAAELVPVMLEQGAERAKNRLHARKPENE